MPQIRVGLIGVGKHGERYARHIKELEALRLVAISRTDEQAGRDQASKWGCSYHQLFEDLIADPQVEVVVAAAPPTVNLQIALLAAAHRKPLLIEKPFAVSVSSGKQMIEAVKKYDSFCMVAHTLRFNHVVSTMKRHVGEVGPLHGLCLSQRFEPSSLAWLDRLAVSGGGIMIHTGVHSFDLARYLTGAEPRAVVACQEQVITRETEDSFAALLVLEPGGLLATVAGSRATAGRSGYIEVAGRLGQLVGDHVHGHATLLVGRDRKALATGPPTQTVKEVLESFAHCLRSGQRPPITARDGLAAVAAAEACYRSARSGRVEPVEPYD